MKAVEIYIYIYIYIYISLNTGSHNNGAFAIVSAGRCHYLSTGGRPLSVPSVITHVKIKAITDAEGSNVWCIYVKGDLLSGESLLLEEFLRDMVSFIVRLCQFWGRYDAITPMAAMSLNGKILHARPPLLCK